MSTCTVKKVENPNSISIIGGRTYNPSKYFPSEDRPDRPELLYYGFSKTVLPLIKNQDITLEETELGFIDLKRKTGNEKIRAMLPEGHVFEDVNHFLCQLAWLVDYQSGGEEGRLQTAKRLNNVFYVRSSNGEIMVVSVYFSKYVSKYMDDPFDGEIEWHFKAEPLDDYRWSKDTRVFSATST